MKNIFLIVIIIILTMTACNTIKNTTKSTNSLQGEWGLKLIEGSTNSFESLFPAHKPTLIIDLSTKKVSGKNGCNNYLGNYKIDGTAISFKDSKMAVTMMACPGNGDAFYMEMLKKIDRFSITEDGKELLFFGNNIEILRFVKL